MALNDNWHDIAKNVWKSPESIYEKLITNNNTLDCLKALKEKYGDEIHLMYATSTRDGDLAKIQTYFDTGVMEVDEKRGDVYQNILKIELPKFKEAGVNLFVWDGVAYYDDPRNLTSHTIIATPAIWVPFKEQGKSVAEWIDDIINGKSENYGLDLVNREYPKTGK